MAAELRSLFPHLSPSAVSTALEKASGDVNAAAMELLSYGNSAPSASSAGGNSITEDDDEVEMVGFSEPPFVDAGVPHGCFRDSTSSTATSPSVELVHKMRLPDASELSKAIKEKVQNHTIAELCVQNGKRMEPLAAIAGLEVIAAADVRFSAREVHKSGEQSQDLYKHVLQNVTISETSLRSVAQALLAIDKSTQTSPPFSKRSASQPLKNSGPKKKPKAKTKRASTAWAAGTGFGGEREDDEWEHTHASELTAAEDRHKEADKSFTTGLGQLLATLRGLPRDPLTDAVALTLYPGFAILASGPLPSLIISLLRNDSLMDVVARKDLYHTLFALLKFLSSDRALAELLLMTDGESDKSPEQLLSAMFTQAKVFLANTDQVAAAVVTDTDAIESADMAMTVREHIETIHANLAAIKTLRVDVQPLARKCDDGTADGKKKRSRGTLDTSAQSELATKYELDMGKLRFELVQLAPHGKWPHCFAKNITAGTGMAAAVTRRMKELSSMATGLPVHWSSSIFVRADEQRTDVMKALVIGPEDTPYANGCFCFDVFLPPDYPGSSPLVQLVTTHGGTVRFNPNLYADGKVCLSLLGTWEGPGWNPKESTIMQVLISIQSLILVPDPYFNEPGNESGGRGQSRIQANSQLYNRFIRLFTARVAMIEALEMPEEVFAHVIRSHFRLKKEHIKKQVADWLAAGNAPPQDGGGKLDLGDGPYGVEDACKRRKTSRNGPGTMGGTARDFEPGQVYTRLLAALDAL